MKRVRCFLLVLGAAPRNRPQRPKRGPIVVVDGHAFINVLDGFAVRRQPTPVRRHLPVTKACRGCGSPFEAHAWNSAYCAPDCQRDFHAAERVAAEMVATRRCRRRR